MEGIASFYRIDNNVFTTICIMNQVKRRKLEANGWRVGTVAQFLGLSSEESRLIELTLQLSKKQCEQDWNQMTQLKSAGSDGSA